MSQGVIWTTHSNKAEHHTTAGTMLSYGAKVSRSGLIGLLSQVFGAGREPCVGVPLETQADVKSPLVGASQLSPIRGEGIPLQCPCCHYS